MGNEMFYEEIMLNQWQPLQTLIYDGWILRFADGYTKRANSIQPLYPSNIDIHEKIRYCEELYSSQGLRTVFRLSPFTVPTELDAILQEEGYEAVDRVSVQTLDLRQMESSWSVSATVRISDRMRDEWIDQYCLLNSVDDKHKPAMKLMLSNSCFAKGFVSIELEGEVVACGLGMVERKCLGIYDIVVSPKHRYQGWGEQLVTSILRWGREMGAEHGSLAVLMENIPALRLYSKLGFTEAYQYWFRVK